MSGLDGGGTSHRNRGPGGCCGGRRNHLWTEPGGEASSEIKSGIGRARVTNFRRNTFRLRPSGLGISSLAVIALCALVAWPLAGWAKDKDKEKQSAGEVVDSGSFGVYRAGQRVATETFSIHSGSDGRLLSSQFKTRQDKQKTAEATGTRLTPTIAHPRYF